MRTNAEYMETCDRHMVSGETLKLQIKLQKMAAKFNKIFRILKSEFLFLFYENYRNITFDII